MTSSATDQRDDAVLDAVPCDLLLIHQRLEDDGGSWRTTLPRPDKLLRRVRVRPHQHPLADHVALSSASLASPTRRNSTVTPTRSR
ncbi:MAG: hypothetical protein ACM3N4_09485 [Nitrososphaerota archaeon]